MKVRWTEGSLRLRITPKELSSLTRGEVVSVALRLPGGIGTMPPLWTMILAGNALFTRLSDGDGHTVRLELSNADTERLAVPETEGIYFQIADVFSYYVEKDFPCIHPRPAEVQESPTATFAPPSDFAARKV